MNYTFFLARDWVDELKETIGMLGEGLMRSIFYPLCAQVYKMIYYFYNAFEVLCNGQLLKSSELNTLFGRVSLLLGVIMLFRVAFAFIQALIDPDTGLGDKEKGIPKLIFKVVMVIIMFGVSGYIFNLAAYVQAQVIKNNVISRFLLPEQVEETKFGGALAANLFTTFYHINPNVDQSTFSTDSDLNSTYVPGVYEEQIRYGNTGACAHEEIYMNGLRNSIKYNNDFDYMKNQCLSAKGVYADENGNETTDDEWIIEFNYVFCLVVGIAVLWFLINYCLSVGIRVIQLTVLQILSPIAFIGFLEPKSDNMFSKWLKVYISTYVDVFIRMGIINFVCYLSSLIMRGWNGEGDGVFWNSVGNPTGMMGKVIGIFMILALFQFAKKAPDLLKSIFPTGASGLSLGTNKEAFKPLNYGLRAAGALGGAAAFGVMAARGRYADSAKYRTDENGEADKSLARRAALGGFGSGVMRGLGVGFKKGNVFSNLKSGYNAQIAKDDEYRDLIAAGGSKTGQVGAYISNIFGSDRGSKDEIDIRNAKTVEDVLKTFSEKAEGTQTYQNLMLEIQGAYNNGETAKAAALRKLANDWKERYIQRSVNGNLNSGDMIDADGGTYVDNNGQTVTLTRSIETSGGDVQRGNGMRSAYVELASQMNAIHTEARGANGIDKEVTLPNGHVISDFTMKSENTVTYQDIDDLLKAARLTQDNVKKAEGFRAGQANRPKNSRNNNNN